MKRIAVAIFPFLILFVFAGCLKNDTTCTPKTVQSEEAQIINYAATNGISATAHSSGLYYQVITPGSGARPSITSSVSVKYTGMLTDGTIFDQKTSPTSLIPVKDVIAGWQIGLPLIQKGGTIKLIIPSSLGYGCTAFGVVPANSILYFEIELVDVQ